MPAQIADTLEERPGELLEAVELARGRGHRGSLEVGQGSEPSVIRGQGDVLRTSLRGGAGQDALDLCEAQLQLRADALQVGQEVGQIELFDLGKACAPALQRLHQRSRQLL